MNDFGIYLQILSHIVLSRFGLHRTFSLRLCQITVLILLPIVSSTCSGFTKPSRVVPAVYTVNMQQQFSQHLKKPSNEIQDEA